MENFHFNHQQNTQTGGQKDETSKPNTIKKFYFLIHKNIGKTLALFLMLIISSYWVNGATYYSKVTGYANVLATWGQNTDGTGTAPGNFTTSGDVFNLRSGSTLDLNADWVIESNVTLIIAGTLNINGNNNNVTINGVVEFTNINSTQVTLAGAGSGNSFILGTNATLKTSNQNGISGTNCSLPASATKKIVTLPLTANYEFNGATNQATTGLPTTVNNLMISGSGVKTAVAAITVNGTLSISSELAMSTYALSAGTSFATSGTGTLDTQNTTASPIPTGKTWSFLVNYRAAGAQTVSTGTYTNLTLSNSGAKTFSATTTINGILSIEGSASASGTTPNYGTNATLQYKGSVAQTVGPAFPATFSGTGGVIINNNTAAVNLTGSRSIGNGSSLKLVAGNFNTANNLTMNSTSTIYRSGGYMTGTIQGSGIYDVVYTANSKSTGTGTALTGSGLRNITVNLTAGQTLTLANNRTPAGNISVESGIFDLGSYTINRSTTGGSFSVSEGATLKIGGTNTFPSNYAIHILGITSAVEYTGTTQTVSAETYGNLTLSGSGTKTLAGITTVSSTLTNGATAILAIPSTLSLTANSIVNNGTVNINSTSATATGSLIAAASSGSGTYNVQRYVFSTKWHVISSPVSGQALGSFASTNNLEYYQPGATILDYDLAPYVESSNTWSPYTTPVNSNPFGMATGYSMRRRLSAGTGAVVFTGTGIHTGSQTLSGLAKTNPLRGWNCIGNPYTSAISSIAFLAKNGAYGDDVLDHQFHGLYYWDEANNDYNVYSFASPGRIAVGMGFFVRINSNGAGIDFTPAMQVADNAAPFKSTLAAMPVVNLQIQNNEATNTATLNFGPDMTRGLDPGYDLGKFKGNTQLALYTRLLEDSGIDFQVQALPDTGFDTYRIPVGLDVPGGGEVTFTATAEYMPAETEVILEDASLKSFTRLDLAGAEYTTNVSANTSGTGRFYLLTSKNMVTSAPVTVLPEFKVFTGNRTITIDGPANANTQFALYSIDGKMWFLKNADKTNHNTIDANRFASGVYLLRIIHEGEVTPVKIVLH